MPENKSRSSLCAHKKNNLALMERYFIIIWMCYGIRCFVSLCFHLLTDQHDHRECGVPASPLLTSSTVRGKKKKRKLVEQRICQNFAFILSFHVMLGRKTASYYSLKHVTQAQTQPRLQPFTSPRMSLSLLLSPCLSVLSPLCLPASLLL